MGRLSKTTQAAFDALDLPCAKRDIDNQFAPKVRTALDCLRSSLPAACVQSVIHVAKEIASVPNEVPTGYGSALVKHFYRRSDQIQLVVGEEVMSTRSRFAFIELTALACMAGKWITSEKPEKSMKIYKTRMRDVAAVEVLEQHELELWRKTVAFLLDGPPVIPAAARNFAHAFVWGGYISPDHVPEEKLADWLGETREPFIRSRQEGLRTLSMLRNARFPEQGQRT